MTATRIKGSEELNETQMSYWKLSDGAWMLYIPGCGAGTLRNHTVEEHKDGTITVTPSILMTGHNRGTVTQKHGYLTKGIWKDC